MPTHASGQPLPEWVHWACCGQVHDNGTPCTGIAQTPYGRCLAHLDDAQLVEVARRGKAVDARGVRLTADDLERVLVAARLNEDDPYDPFYGPFDLPSICLWHAVVTGGVSLRDATVEGEVNLIEATVEGDVRLDGATVKGRVDLRSAEVKGDVGLHSAEVKGDVGLRSAKVKGRVDLGGAKVGRVDLREAKVEGRVDLGGAKVEGEVDLGGARVEGEAQLGPMSVTSYLVLAAEFTRPASLDVIAPRVVLSRARFLRGLTARVGKAEVVMERVEVQGHAVLADAPTLLVHTPTGPVPASPPRLLQLTGTDVARLTLTGVDLAACHFSGTINLDELRIDGSPQLAVRRGRWRAQRKVLAEEHVWRHVNGPARRRDGWYPPESECRPRDPSDPNKAQQIIRDAEASAGSPKDRAEEIASVYRALRKGREDAKDEPGAADFYYGEMEMRRAAASGWEWALLTLYWLVSGYALRASRSLAAFAVVVTVFAILLSRWGFQPASTTRISGVNLDSGAVSYAAPLPDLGGAFAYSVESATAFFRGPGPEQLTKWGSVFQVCLRLLGPALLALTVLAVRGRVKR